MITLHIARFCDSPMGTFGRLRATNGFECYTCERPWKDNANFISCIPAGRYEVIREQYHKGGYAALQVQNVPGRDEVLFHVGNTMMDVEGCIAVGSALGWSEHKKSGKFYWSVINSKPTFQKLMDSLDLLSNIEVRIVWQIPLAAAVDPTTRV